VFVGFTAKAFDDREATEDLGKQRTQHLEVLLSAPIERSQLSCQLHNEETRQW
jgi:hypothetical protein